MLTHDHTIAEGGPDWVAAAIRCLETRDPGVKCAIVAGLPSHPGAITVRAVIPLVPGRPAKPELVDPRQLPRRQLGSQAGHAAFVHAICHIEFTAINLALDAAVRFSGMPAAYYADWIGVAKEEAIHYSLLEDHLRSLGYVYGDFVAHDGLWDMAERTADDILRRMALVPRVMEARGLDVTPPMIDRLNAIGDLAGAQILERILADEIRHVAVGSHWFKTVCGDRGLEPETTFAELVAQEFGTLRGSAMNYPARQAAGFSTAELDALSLCERPELAPATKL
ncbi:MAG: ferritin-like domain-containing protein [Gammaproteobacteria bacterium]